MTENILRYDKHCRLCGGYKISTIMHLNDTPLEDQFVSQQDLNIAQQVYPLDLALCEDCGYVYLPYIVSPEASYSDYVYVSGLTVGLRNHYDMYAQNIINDFEISKNSLVVDLGSNDGSMLSSFKRLDMNIIGVEPASNIAAIANESGLTTINDFFTDEVASKILDMYGTASVVTANYMYANIDDVIQFTKNVAKTLSPDGIFVVQTGYHPEQMKIKMFDYIYHEHFSYFTVEVLKELFSNCGMQLIHAQKTSPKGGSIRIIGQLKNGSRTIDPSVQTLINEECDQGMRDINTYKKFSSDVDESKKILIKLLTDLKSSGKKIVGFGASHSTTTLIYHFELAPFFDYLIDDNEVKQGRYSPGHHLPVYSSSKLSEDHPDCVVVLAWQHAESILKNHKENHPLIQWILPLPDCQMI
jgi:hypothetical protein